MPIALFTLLMITQPQDFLRIPEAGAIEVKAVEVNEVFEIDTLDLAADSLLRLEDFKSVRIRRLIATDGARIQLAAPNSGRGAGASADGGDGARAVFFIDQVEGHVVIEAKGGRGGDGAPGWHGQQGTQGAKGRDARRLFWFIYLGRGDNGHPGEPGQDGQDGGDGGNGGSGGWVQVFYREKNPESRILVDVSGGEGGQAGRGGRGGIGGNGGSGGRGSPNGSQGRMGAPGKNGSSGSPGRPGHSGQVEIYQTDRSLFRCLLFAHLTGDDISDGEWDRCVLGG